MVRAQAAAILARRAGVGEGREGRGRPGKDKSERAGSNVPQSAGGEGESQPWRWQGGAPVEREGRLWRGP